MKIILTYIHIYGCVSIYNRSTFKRDVNITREEQQKKRVDMATETLPLEFSNEDVRLTFEKEIAFANINKNKQECKARKVMQCVSNAISGATTGAEA